MPSGPAGNELDDRNRHAANEGQQEECRHSEALREVGRLVRFPLWHRPGSRDAPMGTRSIGLSALLDTAGPGRAGPPFPAGPSGLASIPRATRGWSTRAMRSTPPVSLSARLFRQAAGWPERLFPVDHRIRRSAPWQRPHFATDSEDLPLARRPAGRLHDGPLSAAPLLRVRAERIPPSLTAPLARRSTREGGSDQTRAGRVVRGEPAVSAAVPADRWLGWQSGPAQPSSSYQVESRIASITVWKSPRGVAG